MGGPIPETTHLSLADQAYRALKDLIIDLELPPGALFTERELLEVADVSRASLRVALQRLIQERWISSQARRGFVISPLTLKDADELFELRSLLEPRAVYLAAGKLGPKDHDALLRRIAQGFDPKDPASLRSYLQASSAFHMSFAYASGVERLARVLLDLSETRTRYARLSFQAYALTDLAAKQYGALSALVCSGKAQEAHDFHIEYLQGARANVMAALASRPEILTQNLGPRQNSQIKG